MAIGGFSYGKYINIGPKQQPLGGSSRLYQNEIDIASISSDQDTDCAFVFGTANTVSGGAAAVIGSGNIVHSGALKNMAMGTENVVQSGSDDSAAFDEAWCQEDLEGTGKKRNSHEAGGTKN